MKHPNGPQNINRFIAITALALTISGTLPMGAHAALPAKSTAATATTCAEGSGAWLGSFGYGVNCADAAGWQSFNAKGKSITSDQVQDIEVCNDRVVVAHTLGLSTRNKGKWKTDRFKSGISSPSGIDCDAKGNVWLAHYDGVTRYDGKTWTTHKADKLGTGKSVKVVKDVAVAPDGKVWAVTANSVAMYDGSAWKVWEKGTGFDKEYFFNHIVVDAKGFPWLAVSGALLTLEDSKWTEYENSDIFSPEGLAIDAKGQVYIGSYSSGLFVMNDSGWETYNRENSDISSNHVRAVAVDGRGRVWAATEYGLDVFDGETWTNYHMHTSDMVDNDIRVLEVEGAGPDLPELFDPRTGGLIGVITNGSKPAASVEVQLCVLFIGGSFRGDTPCEDDPFNKLTKTGKDGKFEFKGLPVGHYGLVFKQPNGKWARLVSDIGIGSERITVREGETVDDISLDLSKVKTK
jgi:sugar lactone lactonase YvrE